MLQTIFYLFASFIGVYINVWYLLLIFEKKPLFFKARKPKKLPKVSILIPAHNEEAVIGQTLDSILNIDYPKGKLDIIVIDNGSTDNTSKIVKKFSNVKLVKQKKPGKAKALNNGLKFATGKIIGVLDADTLVAKNCLKKTVGYFEDPKVGAVTNFVKVDSKKGLLGKMQNIEYLFSAITKKLVSFLDSMYIVPGTLSLIRGKLTREIGFSEDTLTEDMDIALSISKKDYKIVNCLDTVAYTNIPKNFKTLTSQRIRWYRGFIQNSIKHRDLFLNKKFPHLTFVIPMSFVAIFIGTIIFFLSLGQVVNAITLFSKSIFYMSFSDQVSLALVSIPRTIIRMLSSYLFIAFILVFSTSFTVLFVSLKSLRKTNKADILLLPVYMLAYYFLIMLYWVFAIMLELIRWRKKW